MFYPRNLCYTTLLFFFFFHNALSQTAVGVSVSPNGTRQTAQYQLTFEPTNGNPNNLNAGVGTITLRFPSAFRVPASISNNAITINGLNVPNVTVSGNDVTITVPTLIKNPGGPNASIIIFQSAGISNPAVAGSYTIQAFSSTQGVPVNATPAVTIVTTTSTVSIPAVTPNPSIENVLAGYSVGFNLGSGGSLDAGVSTVVVTFPSGTTVPQGVISGVSLNNTGSNAVGSGDSVIVTAPLNLSSNSGVTIVFSQGSGLRNPALSGTYSLVCYTSSELTPVTSSPYQISSPLDMSITAVGLSTATANANSSYGMDFYVSTSGALVPNQNTIQVTLPNKTLVPTSIAGSNVTVSSANFTSAVSVIGVNGNTISFRTPVAIAANSLVTVNFSTAAGIQNPTTAGGYTLFVATRKNGIIIDSPTSNPFSISPATTSISQPIVSLSSSAAAATNVTYTVIFSVGALGRLQSNADSVFVTFPVGTTIPGTTTVTINGSTTTAAWNATTRQLRALVPTGATPAILNNGTVTLSATGVTNPAAGTYTLSAFTNVETSSIQSQNYGIGTSITVGNVVLNDYRANRTASYQINCTGVANLRVADNHIVTVFFPEGTVLPATIANASITFTGGQSVSSVSVNQTERSVVIAVGSNNQGFTQITFAAAAGIINPSVPATSYRVRVSTSVNPPIASSNAYTIFSNNTSPAVGTVTISPAVINASSVSYSIPVTTSGNGRLIGGLASGSSFVEVEFPNPVSFPASINAGNILLNGNAITTVTSVDQVNRRVQFLIPNGVTIANSTPFTVTFTLVPPLQMVLHPVQQRSG